MNHFYKTKLLSTGLLLILTVTVLGDALSDAAGPPVCKKQIPEITFQNLPPPYKNYNYFQNRQSFPFAYEATSFNLINAWWLAEAAMLVYADEAFVREQFGKAEFDHVYFFDGSSTQCFVATNSRFAIVAFRGSEIWKQGEPFELGRIIADWSADIDVQLSEWKQGGKVHSGFKAAFEEVEENLTLLIESLQGRGLRIWVTGHSLGAALATLAADRWQNVQGVYTFGSPRVGDKTFKENFITPAFRVVNGEDIVASVPPPVFYSHVGKLVSINTQGKLQFQSNASEHSDTISCLGDSDKDSQNSVKEDTSVFIPIRIRDHVPLLYSVILWNELIETSGRSHRFEDLKTTYLSTVYLRSHTIPLLNTHRIQVECNGNFEID